MHVPWGKTLFFVSSKLSVYTPFQTTLNYVFTANIGEVMKFYNLGDKTFETDFNKMTFYRTQISLIDLEKQSFLRPLVIKK